MRPIVIIPLLAALLAGCSPPPPGDVQTDRYLVGAYYYLWFPGNFRHGFLRARLDPPQEPALGFYRSADPSVAAQHIAWAAPNGIDFFAVDWWPTRPEQNAALADAFLQAPNIGDIKFCVFYESWALGFNKDWGATVFDDAKRRQFVDDVVAIADRFFGHPSYLRVGGRPVLMLYLTRTFAGEFAEALRDARRALKQRGHDMFLVGDEIFWNVTPAVRTGTPHPLVAEPQVRRLRAFDAITSYNMYEGARQEHRGYGARSAFLGDVARQFEAYRDAAEGRVYFVPGLIPGYNDRGVRRVMDHFAVPRQWDRGDGEGSFLARAFDRIGFPFADPRLNMILLTSWNEWNEDTAIEPLAEAPPTSRDASGAAEFFTQGYRYAGHGFAYLETIRDQVVAASGRAARPGGAPAAGVEIRAWADGRVVATDRSRSDGSFRLSRLRMPPGLYEVGLEGGARTAVEVLPRTTATGLVFTVPPK